MDYAKTVIRKKQLYPVSGGILVILGLVLCYFWLYGLILSSPYRRRSDAHWMNPLSGGKADIALPREILQLIFIIALRSIAERANPPAIVA